MKVPKYIEKKMRRIAALSGKASKLEAEVCKWLESNGIDPDEISNGDGYSFEELMYGNDVTDALIKRISGEEYP